MKIIATVGASGSGKSTWTCQHIYERAAHGERWVELNKDQLRTEMIKLRGGSDESIPAALKAWSYDPDGPDETEMKALLMARLIAAKESGADGVVFSNINVDGGAQVRGQLARAGIDPARMELKAFPLDFEECVRRDAARPLSVGVAVIEGQFKKLAALGVGFPCGPSPAKAAAGPRP